MCNKNLLLPNKPTRVGTFADRLVRYVRERFRGDAPFVYTAAWIDRRTWSAIITDPHRRPFPFASGEAQARAAKPSAWQQDVLLAAGFALSPVIAEDAVFAFCIQSEVFDLFEVNRILYEQGLKIIPPK